MEITADFGDKTYSFRVGCTADADGEISFVVIAPESIAGITGSIKADTGYLHFDDTVLAFPLLADGEISPISAPWLLIKTLRSGYIAAAGMDGDALMITLNDSYEADALQLDVWLNQEDIPIGGEFLWQGRRIISIDIEEFMFV